MEGLIWFSSASWFPSDRHNFLRLARQPAKPISIGSGLRRRCRWISVLPAGELTAKSYDDLTETNSLTKTKSTLPYGAGPIQSTWLGRPGRWHDARRPSEICMVPPTTPTSEQRRATTHPRLTHRVRDPQTRTAPLASLHPTNPPWSKRAHACLIRQLDGPRAALETRRL